MYVLLAFIFCGGICRKIMNPEKKAVIVLGNGTKLLVWKFQDRLELYTVYWDDNSTDPNEVATLNDIGDTLQQLCLFNVKAVYY